MAFLHIEMLGKRYFNHVFCHQIFFKKMNYYAEEFFFPKRYDPTVLTGFFSLMIYELELTGGDNNYKPFD